MQSVFKSNLNKILRGRYRSEEQKKTLQNIIKAVIKLFNDYSSIASEAKYKETHGKGRSSMLARIAKVCVSL